RVLAFDPDNFHALANRTHYLCVTGRLDDARRCAERLKAVQSTALDVWIKKAEALSYLGDDEGVLAAFKGAEQTGHQEPPRDDALLYHLAAVAALRLGREGQARQHWQHALKLAPGMELAAANLVDSRQPVGKRHAPWAFSFHQWVPHAMIRELAAQVAPAARRGRE